MLLAALVAALLMSFWSTKEARESTQNIRQNYHLLRVGLLLVAAGILLSLTGGSLDEATGQWLKLTAFPLYYVGIVLIEASTWPPRATTPREVAW